MLKNNQKKSIKPKRSRYPHHPASKMIENSEPHRKELEKLISIDGDFHHGFNSGVFVGSDDNDGLVQKHEEKVEKLKTNFADLAVETFTTKL